MGQTGWVDEHLAGLGRDLGRIDKADDREWVKALTKRRKGGDRNISAKDLTRLDDIHRAAGRPQPMEEEDAPAKPAAPAK